MNSYLQIWKTSIPVFLLRLVESVNSLSSHFYTRANLVENDHRNIFSLFVYYSRDLASVEWVDPEDRPEGVVLHQRHLDVPRVKQLRQGL